MLKFYWSLGADIVRLEKDQPWGSKFMQRVSADLKAWMPEAKCFSVRNLQYMRLFASIYGGSGITHQVGAQIVHQLGDQLQLGQFEAKFPNVSKLLFAVLEFTHFLSDETRLTPTNKG